MELLLLVSLWVYAHSEVLLIIVQVLLSANIIFVYTYMKETIMLFWCKFMSKRPSILPEILKDRKYNPYFLQIYLKSILFQMRKICHQKHFI